MRVDHDVTVIIPYSGDYRYLKLCLKIGLVYQELKPKHLIIVFDNCENDMISDPDKYNIPDVEVTSWGYLDSEGQGNRAAVRNAGIVEAKTEWVFLLDEDVILFPSYFKELQRIVENIPDNHVTHGSLINRKVNVNIKTEEIYKLLEMHNRITDKDRAAPSTIRKNRWMSFCTGNLLVNKQLMHDAGLFDEKIKGWGEEDTEMGFRIHQHGAEFYNRMCIRGFHLTRENISRRTRNKGWAKNLEYTLKKHKGTDYAKQRQSSLNFARRYS